MVISPSREEEPILPWKFKLPKDLTVRSKLPSIVDAKVTSALLFPVVRNESWIKMTGESILIDPPLVRITLPPILILKPASKVTEPEGVKSLGLEVAKSKLKPDKVVGGAIVTVGVEV